MKSRLAKVPLFGNVAKAATVNLDATNGAQVGVNLFGPDGKLVRWEQILNSAGATAPSSAPAGAAPTSTDDVEEGSTRLYFTSARVYAAVKAQLLAGAGVTITPDDVAKTLTLSAAGGGSGSGSQALLSTAIMALGPKLYYKCDEAAGATVLADSSGNGMDLTLKGTNVLHGFELVPGGGCVASPSSNSANGASRTGPAGLTLPTSYDYTVVAVSAVITSTNQNGVIFQLIADGETAPTNVQVEMYYKPVVTGVYQLAVLWEYGSGTNVEVNGPTVPIGVPFVAGVRKNTATKTVDFFINGKLVYTTTYSNEPTGGDSVNTFLNSSSGGASLSHLITSNVAFFDKALTDAQMKTISQAAGLG